MKKIVNYIFNKYDPNAIILYGSYANGTNNENSDFDALIISNSCQYSHDSSYLEDIQLDLFVYPVTYFQEPAIDFTKFVQIFDGEIIIDENNLGSWLKTEVNKVIKNLPYKTYEENKTQVEWCEKMLKRTLRTDVEGSYRLHWLIVDSLEIYFDICSLKFLGPKKALNQMKEKDLLSYNLYSNATKEATYESLSNWIQHLRCLLEK